MHLNKFVIIPAYSLLLLLTFQSRSVDELDELEEEEEVEVEEKKSKKRSNRGKRSGGSGGNKRNSQGSTSKVPTLKIRLGKRKQASSVSLNY